MISHFPAARSTGLPLALIEQAIPKLSRHDLEGLTERLIDRLDEIDGDMDVETNGDELDGSLGEDDFHRQSENWRAYPGCPLSDPDMGAEDYAFDPEEDMCEAGDDGCGPVLIHGSLHWGATEDGTDRLARPKYGLDQTRGPLSP